MLRIIAYRVIAAIPMLWAVATAAFLLVNVLPGDVAQRLLGEQATQAQLEELREKLGLNRPIGVQYLDWLSGVVRGDFGNSLVNGASVTAELNQRLPVTMSLALGATIVAGLLGLLLGVLAATLGGWTDRIVRIASSVAMGIPGFWAAVLLVLVFAVALGLVPATGYVGPAESVPGWIKTMILPVAAVALASVASLARQARSATLDVFGMNYVRTLRAVGVPRFRILTRHVLRNASIPVITLLGVEFTALLSGSVIVEQVFALPGISRLAIDAVYARDRPVVLGVVVYAALIVLLANLLVDVVSAALNPRLRSR